MGCLMSPRMDTRDEETDDQSEAGAAPPPTPSAAPAPLTPPLVRVSRIGRRRLDAATLGTSPSARPGGRRTQLITYLTPLMIPKQFIYTNIDLPVIGSLVYCESSALRHAAIEAAFTVVDKKTCISNDNLPVPGPDETRLAPLNTSQAPFGSSSFADLLSAPYSEETGNLTEELDPFPDVSFPLQDLSPSHDSPAPLPSFQVSVSIPDAP
ncbi:unnamed protein product [Timema podura]|uniref:Uncharacterized protein n=1 Tax=Timema podura TaxID=61482 RepID=A0ABN7NRT6_TIMPD|nr:unnamed protein product [Timema podura]